MSDERDPRIADALARIEVPDYTPGFWERLDERLADEGDLVVVPLARRSRGPEASRSRRSLALIAAAAAAVIAILAVSLTRSGDEDPQLADPAVTQPDPKRPAPGAQLAAPLGVQGATDTPQDAFHTWLVAVHDGDAASALERLGPLTRAYFDSLGADPAELGAAYQPWLAADSRFAVLDLGEVGGEHVVGLIMERPDATARFGTAHEAVAMVETDDGWKVEPAAFDPARENRIEPVQPAPGEDGLTPLQQGEPVRIATQPADVGVYYVGVDRQALSGYVPADARDGIVEWEPTEPLEVGVHLLVVAHVSPSALVLFAVPFEVVEAS